MNNLHINYFLLVAQKVKKLKLDNIKRVKVLTFGQQNNIIKL